MYYCLILLGYIRFLNDRRDTVRNENPNMSFAELTKLLANEWMNLPSDEKQVRIEVFFSSGDKLTENVALFGKIVLPKEREIIKIE